MKLNLYRVTGSNGRTRYIRASSIENAKKTFYLENNEYASLIELTTERIFAVFFSDFPWEPAYFKGTKTEVLKSARLYIKQWQLDAKISQIIEM